MKVLLVGANGYGTNFLQPLFDLHKSGQITFEGIVTRSAFPMQDELLSAGIQAYKTLDAFYAEHSADLALISTPAYLHKEQSLYCVQHGSNVLCEKPAAPTAEEAEEMIRAEKETGKFIAIGYQRCFSDAILSLKKDILDGLLGKPLSAKSLITSPRGFDYYSRGGGYAGQIYTKDGRIILDSPASNACAHDMQEMFFLLGNEMDSTAELTLVSGECMRANDITNFDTCVLKMTANSSIPVHYVASHATESRIAPRVCYKFEKAIVNHEDGQLTATFLDGTVKNYGRPLDNMYTNKIHHCLDAIKNGTTPVCTVKTALEHIKMIGNIYRTIPVKTFTENEVTHTQTRVYVPGLNEKLLKAFEKECMISEL